MSVKEEYFSSQDGMRLFSRVWPAEPEKGRVLLVHGFAEHTGRYRQLAEDLVARGFTLAAFDLRGHGQSDGRRAHVDAFADYLLDLDVFFEKQSSAGNPPWLLGHSLGGLIAARYLQTRERAVAGLILSSPFLGMSVKVPAIKAWLGKLMSSILPALSMSTGLDPAVLSHDERVVKAYRDDPLVSKIASARWFTETLEAQRLVLERARQLRQKLLVLQAGEDKLSDLEATRKFFEAAQSPGKRMEIYQGFLHEVFNEVERARPVQDLLAFLEASGE